jgi:hypothetical protein
MPCAIAWDVGLHRGTPNHGPEPRPVLVLGYSISWLRRPEVGIEVPRSVLEAASPVLRRLLRFEPVVEVAAAYTGVEAYGAAALAETSGGSFSKGG